MSQPRGPLVVWRHPDSAERTGGENQQDEETEMLMSNWKTVSQKGLSMALTAALLGSAAMAQLTAKPVSARVMMAAAAPAWD